MTDQTTPDLRFDPYDETAQEVMSWTLRIVGAVLGVKTWEGGDGSESVEGDVACEVMNILKAGGLMTPDGDTLTSDRFAALSLLPGRLREALEAIAPVADPIRVEDAGTVIHVHLSPGCELQMPGPPWSAFRAARSLLSETVP